MIIFRKQLAAILVILLLVQLINPVPAQAAVNPEQKPPQKLRVEAISNPESSGDPEPAIGYNEFDQYYADLACDKLTPPAGVPSPDMFLNYYLQEAGKPYEPSKGTVLKEDGMQAVTDGSNALRLKALRSGTIYFAYTKAYYSYTTPEDVMVTSVESTASNTVKFMTDMAVDAYSYGPNQIKIVWDDVWNSGKRMDYKLYISESKTFTNAQPIYIGQEQISQNGPVTVDQSAGKLVYIHTVRDPGRVYYIKIMPDTSETELKYTKESPTVTVSSFILARTTKMSDTQDGSIWKLEWSPVVTGIADSAVKVSYQIYRGTGTGGNIEQYVASVDDTSFFLTLNTGDESNYYLIKAAVTKNGAELYPGIRIQSQRIYVNESPVPSTPGVPELVSEFTNAGTVILSYKELLTSAGATVLWRVPLNGSGGTDTEMRYDIWLISDPNLLNAPPKSTMVASDLKMTESNFVRSGTKLVGYKYELKGLQPNTVTYFRIVAKKDYVQYADNTLKTVTWQSDPALKIIITPAAGSIHQPEVPGTPPFSLKTDSAGRVEVTSSSAIVLMKDKWYEQYSTLAGGTSAWIYRTPEQLEATSPGAVAAIENGTADPLKFRKVEYDTGVTLDVGCVKYSADMDFSNLDKLQASKVSGFPVTPNDPGEDVKAVGAIPDGKKHHIVIPINDLEPNQTYLVWVRAERRSANVISGSSDPLIITTEPDLPQKLEKPTVPVFNYSDPSDTTADLGWNFNRQLTYYLEYGTSDDRGGASGRLTITPAELQYVSLYKVSGLKPDTQYYFWIQAESVNAAGDKIRSDFSDSTLVRTDRPIAPDTPRGFGIKGSAGSVTKDSITFEWTSQDKLQYILEYASDIDYKDAKKLEAGSVREFTVAGLRSNCRYWFRLYAVDPDKKLTSEPTQSIAVRTLRSSDEYDSGGDTDQTIAGEFIHKDVMSVAGIWSVSITGTDADRFVEQVQTDNLLDYTLDLSAAPAGTRTASVRISGDVLKALGQIGEDLILRTTSGAVVIRAGSLASGSAGSTSSASSSGEAVYRFAITQESTESATGQETADILEDSVLPRASGLTLKTPVMHLEIECVDGRKTPVIHLARPLKILYGYTSPSWYKPGITVGAVAEEGSGSWTAVGSTAAYDQDSRTGVLSFETTSAGRLAVADKSAAVYSDIAGSTARASILRVLSVHDLKAIPGKRFEPGKTVTVGEAAKLMLDMLDQNYGREYMTLASRAGILRSADIAKPEASCTREMLIAMAMRVCELKTKQKAVSTSEDSRIYKDIGQINAVFLPSIRYAQENGMIMSRSSDMLGPKDPVTRAEALVLLERVLRFCGEL